MKKIQFVRVDEAHNIFPAGLHHEENAFVRHMVARTNFERYFQIVFCSKCPPQHSHPTFTMLSNASSLLDQIT